MAKATQKPLDDDIEKQLIGSGDNAGAEDPYFSLDEASEDSSYLDLGDEDFLGRNKTAGTLKGDEAMKFLGLPSRPHNHLKRGDLTRIEERFHRYLERLRKVNAENAFWDQIQVRVWNKKNLAKLTAKEIKGKPTAPCPSLGIKPGEYQGDVMGGSAISDFLSEKPNAQKWREYFIQLISVNVTEELSRA